MARWTDDEDGRLMRLYPAASWPEILAALPGRSRIAIRRHVECLDAPPRRLPFSSPKKRVVDPMFVALRRIRRSRGLSQVTVSRRIGVHERRIYYWENGITTPEWRHVKAWLDALGVDLSIATIDDTETVFRSNRKETKHAQDRSEEARREARL